MILTELKELLSASLEAKQDLFLKGVCVPSFSELKSVSDGIPTIVFLPAALYNSETDNVSVINTEEIPSTVPELCIADIHLMKDAMFRDFVESCNFRRMIIPFAELADENEYGYCRGYRWAGEMRSETLHYTQLVCLFSAYTAPVHFSDAYCSKNTVLADMTEDEFYRVIECDNERKKFETVFREARKKAGQSSFVYFPTRTQAIDFSSFCASRGVNVPLITGQTSGIEIRKNLADFISGRVTIIAGTKSMLSIFPVAAADNVIVCSLPFSLSFLSRCLSTGRKGIVVFCADDVFAQRKLIDFYTDNYTEGAGVQIKEARYNMLDSALQKICE